tara:strand:- start:80 stop:391 length:312 start_codon:yes stop_codon:yes gene_type:complete
MLLNLLNGAGIQELIYYIKGERKMLNEELVILSKIQKHLKQSYEDIGDAMIGGGVDNMEKYKYMLGQAHAYLKISQEISNLLEPKEQKNDIEREPNVVDFERP